MTKRAYKYRFYPTKEQEQHLAKLFGCTRFVYNWALRRRTDAWYENEERINYHQTSAELTQLKKEPEYQFLYEVDSVPLQQSLRNLQTAFNNFFVGRARYPKFKKKQGKQSATFTNAAFKINDNELSVRKIGKLNIRWSRSFKGKPTSLTVSKDPAGRYFVSILVDEDISLKKVVKKEVGVDLGIKDVIVTSNGYKSGAPKYFGRHEKRLAFLQREMSRKKKGSKNREKARRKVAKLHAKISDCRKDFTHKLTTQLINENQVICVESLGVKNMLRNKNLSKAISDSGWGELLRQLEYKCDWYGRTLVGIDRWYPSSKRCSNCGFVCDKLPLDIRQWDCPECETSHDRDHNAANNILAAGLAVLACGESVRPAQT